MCVCVCVCVFHLSEGDSFQIPPNWVYICVLGILNCLYRKREEMVQTEGTAAETTKKVQGENDKRGG